MQDNRQANVTNPDRRNRNALKEAAIALYRRGHSQAEILRLKERLVEIHPLGAVWQSLTKSSLTRWINAAKEDDFDLEIQHLLGRRRLRPGMYTNWKPEGKIFLLPYDPLTDTLYLGPGMDYFPYPLGVKEPSNIVRVGNKKAPPTRHQPRHQRKMPDSDAAGFYVAQLRNLNYSIREIQRLWNGEGTKYTKLDRSPQVQYMVSQLQQVRPRAMSHTTIARILKIYSSADYRLTRLAEELRTEEQ
jgi:hypothetical protein